MNYTDRSPTINILSSQNPIYKIYNANANKLTSSNLLTNYPTNLSKRLRHNGQSISIQLIE